MEETVVAIKTFDSISIDPSASKVDIEALRQMKNGMYLIRKGDQEGGSYNWGSIHTMVKKGTIDKLLRMGYIYESHQNSNMFFLSKIGIIITKNY